jgi:DNA-binding winged helix-turn-helix (wHTH) protein/predicted ATPase
MSETKHISFSEYVLDEANEVLVRGSDVIPLRPKLFALLKYLLEHAGQLVTKQQLLDAIWPDTYVGEAVLKDSIRQAREILGDDAKSPKFIETAHRRGYRFIAPIIESSEGDQSQTKIQSGSITFNLESEQERRGVQVPSNVIGREQALKELHSLFVSAQKRDRQIVFVTGEPGIGKTTLVDTFLAHAATIEDTCVAHGQCLEQYGAGEPFLPVLDALSQLCRGSEQARIIGILRKHAPTWLTQMPWITVTQYDEAAQQQLGAGQERMLREMAEALEQLAAYRPVILVLEDLHWSDYSTLDLISYLARRDAPAELMVIGTYRPVELVLSEHPLKDVKQELQTHRLCKELPLEYLPEDSVREFLENKFPDSSLALELSRIIHQRTEGNPLFMVNLVDYLLDERILIQQDGRWRLQSDLHDIELGLPENIRNLIEKQIDRLQPKQQRVLEAASVVGMSSSAVAIAAALDEDLLETEELCEELARRHQFLLPLYLAELPDGTLTPRFMFIHVLYRDVLYNRIALTRRARMHLRTSEKEEEIYGDRVGEIASELALHFDEGRDRGRAVKYYLMAAENAATRFANHEGMALARRGLELLSFLPTSAERCSQEITLRLILGASLMTIKGSASPEVEKVYLPALTLCEQQGASLQLFKVLWSLRLFYMYRGETQRALDIAERLPEQAASLQDTTLMVEAHRALGSSRLGLGEYRAALEQFELAVQLYKPFHQDQYFLIHGNDAKVMSLSFGALLLWCLGYPDRSLERLHEALSLAKGISHTQSALVALHLGARIHQLRSEPDKTREYAQQAIVLANEQGIRHWATLSSLYSGWAEAEQGERSRGIEKIRSALDKYRSTGAKLWLGQFLGLLAGQLTKTGEIDEGINVIDEALDITYQTGERFYEAELHRIRGELFLARVYSHDPGVVPTERDSAMTTAEDCFNRALSVARQQETKSWELRAAISLSELLLERGERVPAHHILSSAYEGFTEGYESIDLLTARSLLSKMEDVSVQRG